MGGYGLPGGSELLVYVMPQVALAIYLVLLWDARRAGSPAAGDEQLGVKTVAGALAITGVVMTATGVQQLLHVLLTFSDFIERIKAAVPDIAAGGVALLIGLVVIMPKSNIAQYPKASRLVAGAIAVGGAVVCVGGLASLLRSVLAWPSWNQVAQALSYFVVAATVLAAGLGRLMKLSGVVVVAPVVRPAPQSSAQVPAAAQPQGYPPQGYPPQNPGGQSPGAPGQWPPP